MVQFQNYRNNFSEEITQNNLSITLTPSLEQEGVNIWKGVLNWKYLNGV
jgi:hypothetical protein